jgi:hypothetical protein
LEVGFNAAREEVASLTSRLTLLEEEYWGVKVGTDCKKIGLSLLNEALKL